MYSFGLIVSLLQLGVAIAEWHKAFLGIALGEIALEVALRLAVVLLVFSCYLSLRRVSRLPLNLTRQTALLTARAAQSLLLATIPLFSIGCRKDSRKCERDIVNGGDDFSRVGAWSRNH